MKNIHIKHEQDISEILNVNNVLQYRYDISKTLRIIKYIFSWDINHYLLITMFDNGKSSVINIYS